MECPLPWVKPGQRYMLALDPTGYVAHVVRVSQWRRTGRAEALCGAEARWSMAIDEQNADEAPCAICASRAAIALT